MEYINNVFDIENFRILFIFYYNQDYLVIHIEFLPDQI